MTLRDEPVVVDDSRDFSNPMYDIKNTDSSNIPLPATTLDTPATISPSAFSTHPAGGQPPPVPPRQLNPVVFDSGKDTQCLVENDSDC